MAALRRLLFLVGQSQAQIVIVGTFGYAEPWHDAVTEGHVVVEDLLEARILVAELFVDFVGGLEGGIHDVARESLENGAAGNKAAQGSRIVRVVVRSEEHTYELQSLMRNSYAVLCLKKQKIDKSISNIHERIDMH